MKRSREGDVDALTKYPIPAIREWAHVMGTTYTTVARQAGISPSMLVWVYKGAFPMRGRLVNRVAHVLGVPASILVRCSPFDEEGRIWARRAALAELRKRLTPAS